MQEHITYINNLKLYYAIAGNKKHTLVIFLHARGARKGSITWLNGINPVIKTLAKHSYVIAPEIPGLIRSETPKDAWGFEEYAKTLHILFTSLQLQTPILIGNSFGGGIATAYVKLYPKEIKAVVLIDSVVGSDYPQTQYVSNLNKKYLHILKAKFIPLWIKKIAVWSRFGTPFRFTSIEDILRKIHILQREKDMKFVIDYASLQVPLILLWGTKDIKVHPIAYARDIVNKAPNATLIEYDGSVPTIYRQPKIMTDVILKAIKEYNSI